MQEVAAAGEDHGDAVGIAGGDAVGVFLGPAGFDDVADAKKRGQSTSLHARGIFK